MNFSQKEMVFDLLKKNLISLSIPNTSTYYYKLPLYRGS